MSDVKVEVRLEHSFEGPYVALYVDGKKVPGMVGSELSSSVDSATRLTATFIIPKVDQ